MRNGEGLVLSVVMGVLLVFSWSVAFAAETATREECIEKVQAAVKLVKEKGEEEALKAVGDAKGTFVWKDSYVFGATADEAVIKAHPIKPALVGKNMLHVKDVNGFPLFAEIAKVASSAEGTGWLEYMWPNSGEKDPAPKNTAVERVPGRNLAVGAGYHD